MTSGQKTVIGILIGIAIFELSLTGRIRQLYALATGTIAPHAETQTGTGPKGAPKDGIPGWGKSVTA